MTGLSLFDLFSLGSVNTLIQVTIVAGISLTIPLILRRHAALRYSILYSGLLLILLNPILSAMFLVTGVGQSLAWFDVHERAVSTELAQEKKPEELIEEAKLTNAQDLPNTSASASERPRRDISSPPVFRVSPNGFYPYHDPSNVSPQSSTRLGETRRRDSFSDTSSIPSASDSTEPIAAANESNREATTQSTSRFDWLQVSLASLMCIWLIGTVFKLGRIAINRIRLTAFIRNSNEIDNAALRELLHQAAKQTSLSNKQLAGLRFCASSQISMPLAAGITRPVIALPSNLVEGSQPKLISEVLLHEMAHVARGDCRVVLLQNIVSSLFWFHPLIHVLNRQLAKAREEVCDNFVLHNSSGPSYGRTLLQLARTIERNEPLPGTVGCFTRRWKLEHRVSGLLDTARNCATRTSMKGRAMVFSIATVCLLLCGSGTLQPLVNSNESIASAATNAPNQTLVKNTEERVALETTTQDEVAQEETIADDDDFPIKEMLIKVIDQDGKPVPNTKIHVSVWYREYADDPNPFPSNQDYQTGDDGTAVIKRPEKLRILRLWASRPDFVPYFFGFEENVANGGKDIPDEFEFQIVKGVKVGGVVIDEQGNPISGAKVEVRVDVEEVMDRSKPSISTWLAEDEDTAVTDQEGRWHISNAPSQDKDRLTILTRVLHDAYVGDSNWGELQKQSNVKTKDFYDQSASIQMPTGYRICGYIANPAGEPIKEGTVLWNDRPYWHQGVDETKIQSDGRFESAVLPAGKYPVTIIAPGFAPVLKEIELSDELQDLHFRLEMGKTITIKVQDGDGNPVPNPWIGIRGWRGIESLHNHIHSNILPSGIPGRGDENGVYQWDWAPEDAVKFQIAARDVQPIEMELVPRSEPYVITLQPRLKYWGRVTDAVTGKPISNFRVTPVNVFRPDFISASSFNASVGRDGRYEHEINEPDDGRKYRFRFEADGYRAMMLPYDLDPNDGPQQIDLKLEPAKPLRGRVVDSKGTGIEKAQVILATPTVIPHTGNTELESTDRADGRMTDANGWFEFPAQSEPYIIRVVAEEGFAEHRFQADDTLSTFQVKPWANLSGRLVQDQKPVAEQRVYFRVLEQGVAEEPRFQDSYYSETDANGQFHFDRIPPGVKGHVHAYLGPWRESPLTSSRSIPLELEPGESRVVTLGGAGAKITGQVVPTGRGDVPLDMVYSLNYLIKRESKLELPERYQPAGYKPNGPVNPDWFMTASNQKWLSVRENHFVKLNSEGQFTIHGIEAGSYDLVIQLYEKPNGCLVESIGQKVIPVKITAEDVNSGSVSLGNIEIPCRVGPRIGSDMYGYSFIDVDGRKRDVAEMEGKYVVFQFWATWCGPCLASMPKVKLTSQRANSEKLVIVGYNIDEDKAAASEYAKRNELNWSQNYLGSSSEIMQQLAISSIPSYFVIGPDRKLVMTSTDWIEVEKKLGELELLQGN